MQKRKLLLSISLGRTAAPSPKVEESLTPSPTTVPLDSPILAIPIILMPPTKQSEQFFTEGVKIFRGCHR